MKYSGVAEELDALDLHADVSSQGVSIHMDGDRDATMHVEGPIEGGEVHDGEVYRIMLSGMQNTVSSEVGFFVLVEQIERLLSADSDRNTESLSTDGGCSSPPDCGVAATGYVCQNEPGHPDDQPEVEMVSSGPGEGGVVCPECGRMAAGPDDEIPYGDPPYHGGGETGERSVDDTERTVCIELTESEADALLAYTKTALEKDDTFDEFRDYIESACGELERSLDTETAQDGDSHE